MRINCDIEIDNEFLITEFPCVCLAYAVLGRVKDIWWCPLPLEISSRSLKAFRKELPLCQEICLCRSLVLCSKSVVCLLSEHCGYLTLLTLGVRNKLYQLWRATISFLSELLLYLCTFPLLSIQHIHFKNIYLIYQTKRYSEWTSFVHFGLKSPNFNITWNFKFHISKLWVTQR